MGGALGAAEDWEGGAEAIEGREGPPGAKEGGKGEADAPGAARTMQRETKETKNYEVNK